jgi:hypothetical protein
LSRLDVVQVRQSYLSARASPSGMNGYKAVVVPQSAVLREYAWVAQ